MVLVAESPSFMTDWPTAYPRARGNWTGLDTGGRWGDINPESGSARLVDPCKDMALPALESARHRGTLAGYRVGRRAIVDTGDTFIKVVRPRRLPALLQTHRELPQCCPTVAFPDVLASSDTGWIELSRAPGSSLHDLVRQPEPGGTNILHQAIDQIGVSLATLHGTDAPADREPATVHRPHQWVQIVQRAEPDVAAELAPLAERLPELAPTQPTIVHGDLHDKNVFASSDGVALIDLDGVGVGVAEDDVANLGVHLELRALQAGRDQHIGQDQRTRLYAAYRTQRDLNLERLEAAERHTWFRLACLYRFRARSRHLSLELLRRAVSH